MPRAEPAPIELYYWPTPNGWKISIALEEMGLPYVTRLVDLGAGAQHEPDFLALSPSGKIPAIRDPEGPDGAPFEIFESGAILLYLARKSGQFCGATERDRIEVEKWLFWQVGLLGPLAGQAHHFLKYAPMMDPPQDLPYAKFRYRNEVAKLYRALDDRLADREFVAGSFFSIADMAIWSWASRWENQEQTIEDKPHMSRWLAACANRPGVQRGRAHYAEMRTDFTDPRTHAAMFGRRA